MPVTENMSVGEVIRRYPAAIPIFQIHHMVVCCRPGRSVGQAARRFGADLPALLRMLNDVAAR